MQSHVSVVDSVLDEAERSGSIASYFSRNPYLRYIMDIFRAFFYVVPFWRIQQPILGHELFLGIGSLYVQIVYGLAVIIGFVYCFKGKYKCIPPLLTFLICILLFSYMGQSDTRYLIGHTLPFVIVFGELGFMKLKGFSDIKGLLYTLYFGGLLFLQLLIEYFK